MHSDDTRFAIDHTGCLKTKNCVNQISNCVTIALYPKANFEKRIKGI